MVKKQIKHGLAVSQETREFAGQEATATMQEITNWQLEHWLSETEIGNIEYADYWNDETHEKSKEFYILDGSFSRMEAYLRKLGLVRDLRRCIRTLNVEFHRELEGIGIDLAAGNLWAAPHLLALESVDKLYCLEYSKLRLLNLGPRVLEHYNVSRERVVLVYGSFYDLHLDDHSLDFVFLSQAFHHADRPDELLMEIKRVLKPTGAVIIIGEHVMNHLKTYLRHAAKFLIARCLSGRLQKRLFGKTLNAKSLLPPDDAFYPDPVMGDHYYSLGEYQEMFSRFGFAFRHFRNHGSQFQSFVLVNDASL